MRTLLFLLLLLTFFSSCRLFGGKRVRGNGNITTREISVTDLENIDASGAVAVYIQQGPTASVQVETDENLMEYLTVRTDGSTLHIETKRGYNLRPSKEIAVRVTTPRYGTLEISGASELLSRGAITGTDLRLESSGAGKIQLELDVDNLTADLSGASTLRLRGQADALTVEASGASKIECQDLTADRADLDLSGASKAWVNVNRDLRVDASGASHIEYRGNASVQSKSSGASSIKKVE